MTRQIRRFLHSEWKHVSKWAYALILVIYAYMVVLQLNSFPMWFCSLRENSFLGFFPDPTLRLSAEDVVLFGNAEVFRGLLFNVAPLAHALYFPFVAACIVPRFVSTGRGQFHASASSLDAHVDLRRDPVGEWSMHLDFN